MAEKKTSADDILNKIKARRDSDRQSTTRSSAQTSSSQSVKTGADAVLDRINQRKAADRQAADQAIIERDQRIAREQQRQQALQGVGMRSSEDLNDPQTRWQSVGQPLSQKQAQTRQQALQGVGMQSSSEMFDPQKRWASVGKQTVTPKETVTQYTSAKDSATGKSTSQKVSTGRQKVTPSATTPQDSTTYLTRKDAPTGDISGVQTPVAAPQPAWTLQSTDEKLAELTAKRDQLRQQTSERIAKGTEALRKDSAGDTLSQINELKALDEQINLLTMQKDYDEFDNEDLTKLDEVVRANRSTMATFDEYGRMPAGVASSLAKAQALQDELIAKYGEDKVRSAMTIRERAINQGEQMQMQSDLSKASGATLVGVNVAARLLSQGTIVDIPEVLKAKLQDIPIDANAMQASSLVDSVTGVTSQRLNEIGGEKLATAYQVVTSTVDSALRIGLGAATGGSMAMGEAYSLALGGLSATMATMREATDRGLSTDAAFLTGVMGGIIETFTEKIGIDALANPQTDIGRYLWGAVSSEGLEEGLSSVLNGLSDWLINGGLSEYEQTRAAYLAQGMSARDATTAANLDMAKQAAIEMAAGALSGGLMGGVSNFVNDIRYRSWQKQQAQINNPSRRPSDERFPEFDSAKTPQDVQRILRSYAKQMHPDTGNPAETFADITDLAGRLDAYLRRDSKETGVKPQRQQEEGRMEIEGPVAQIDNGKANEVDFKQAEDIEQTEDIELTDDDRLELETLTYKIEAIDELLDDPNSGLSFEDMDGLEQERNELQQKVEALYEGRGEVSGEGFGRQVEMVQSGQGGQLEGQRGAEDGYSKGFFESEETISRALAAGGRRGSTSQVVGIGSDEGDIVEVPESVWKESPRAKELEKVVSTNKRYGVNTHFFTGSNIVAIDSTGRRIEAEAVSIGNDTWLRADADQISELNDHEEAHKILDALSFHDQKKRSKILHDIWNQVLDSDASAAYAFVDQLLMYYADAETGELSADILDEDGGILPEIEDYELEEFIADAYGSYIRGALQAHKYHDIVAPALVGVSTERVTRGPPSAENPEFKFSIAPPYRQGTNARSTWEDGLSKEARETYDMLQNAYSTGQENQVQVWVGSGAKRHLAERNITTLFMTASEWNSNCEKLDGFQAAAAKIASTIPAATRKTAGINEDGTITPTKLEQDFKLARSITQRIVDSLPMEITGNTVDVDGKQVKISNRKKIYGVGGEAYRQALVKARRDLYKAGELSQVSVSSLSKDNMGAMGFLATNTKTIASGDFTTLCPQMYFNNGCWYCYRRQALETGVNNKLVGVNVWYTGELLQLTPETIEDLNNVGGLRIQSFGYWQDRFSAQLLDMLVDAETIGLQVKVITKEPSMIDTVALLKDQGYGKNLYFNLSADYTIEYAGEAGADETGGMSPLNPDRPYMRTDDGRLAWKRAMTVQEAYEIRKKHPWVNVRIVATNQDEFIRGLKDPMVQVVTGYHGPKRKYERISSETGETLIEVEALGDRGLPRFAFDKDLGGWKTEYPGRTKKQKELAKKIEAEGLQFSYYIKTCCVTGRCAECNGQCGKLANSFLVKNATNADEESIRYWQSHMTSTEDNPLLHFSRVKSEGYDATLLRKAKTLTGFSGGGTYEYALADLISPEMGIEYDGHIAAVYADNYGHSAEGDVIEMAKDLSKLPQGIDNLHMSPVCCSFSSANNQRGEKPLDIKAAEATAEIIKYEMAPVVTIENVKEYLRSESLKIIEAALEEAGYTYDVDVYRAVDYGAATNRERMFLRAVRDGNLPAKPAKTSNGTAWMDAIGPMVAEQIATVGYEKTQPKWFAERITPEMRNTDVPLFVMGGNASGKLTYTRADQPAPTILAGSTDARILMPGGKVLRVTPQMLAVIQGIDPAIYKLPNSSTLATKIIGNGITTQLTRAVVEPLLMDKVLAPEAAAGEWERIDAEYLQAVERGDMDTATEMFRQYVLSRAGRTITPFLFTEGYRSHRETTKGLKIGDKAAIKEAAEKMAAKVPKNAILIPMPSHTGRATDALVLARAIAKIAGVQYSDLLEGADRPSQYVHKKTKGTSLTEEQMGFKLRGRIPKGKIPIIIDNVVASGMTAKSAVRAVGGGVVLAYSYGSQSRPVQGLKSAEAVTYDKDGKPIPLSKRFDAHSPSVKYSRAIAQGKQLTKEQALEVVQDHQMTLDEWTEAMDANVAADGLMSLQKAISILDTDGNGKTIALGVAVDLVRDGKLDLTGRKLQGNTEAERAAELATLAQVVRNPGFETFRVFYTKGDEIIYGEAFTSGLADVCASMDVEDPAVGFQKMNALMKKIGADGYYLMHNHPSGDVERSRADINVTQSYAKSVPGYRGHIILDHNKFGFIDAGRQEFSVQAMGDVSEEFEQRVIDNPYLYTGAMNSVALSNIAADMAKKDKTILVYMTSRGIIRSMEEVDTEFVLSPKFRGHVADYKVKIGGSNCAALVTDEALQNGAFVKALEKQINHNLLVDAVTPSGQALRVGKVSPRSGYASNGEKAPKAGIRLQEEQVKFSRAVEKINQESNLIAVHGTTEQKLMSALNLEGLPGLSIAVVNIDDGLANEGYGDISLVFDKYTIDPKRKGNSVYGADAWTPTAYDAKVEYQTSYEGQRKFEDHIKSLASKVAGGIFTDSPNIVGVMYSGGDYTHRTIEDVADSLESNASVRAAYLASIGQDVEPVIRTKEYYYSLTNDELGVLLDHLSGAEMDDGKYIQQLLDNVYSLTEEEIADLRQAIRYVYAQNEGTYSAIHADNLADIMVSNVRSTKHLLIGLLEYIDNGRQTIDEVDTRATEERVFDAIWKGGIDKYNAWIREQLKDIGVYTGESGLYNRKSRVTESGSRRSFKSTHFPVTAENIVKLMKMGKARGVGLYNLNAGGVQAVSARKYRSIEDIRADKGRLRELSDEEYEGIMWEANDRLLEMWDAISDSNPEQDDSLIDGAIMTAAAGPYTPSAIRSAFAAEGLEISDEQVSDLRQLINDISKIPSKYFEAKTMRVVGYDEIINAVIPTDASAELVSVLEERGIPYTKYLAGDYDQRLRIIQSMDDVRFSRQTSLASDEDLREMNRQVRQELESVRRDRDRYKKQAEYWKAQTKPSGTGVSEKVAMKMAREWINDTQTTLKRGEVADMIEDLASFMYFGESAGVGIGSVRQKADEIVRKMLDSASVPDESVDVAAYDTIKALCRKKMHISKADADNIPDFSDWRKRHFGKINVSTGGDGISVDSAYQELSDMYPEYFPEDITHPADQLEKMSEVIDSLKPAYRNPYDDDYGGAVLFYTNKLIQDVMGVADGAPTYADMMDQRIRRIQQQADERIEKARQANREKIDRLILHYSDLQLAQRAKRQESEDRTKLLKLAQRLSKVKTTEANRELISEVIGDLDTVARRMTGKTLENLRDLEDWYNERKVSDPDFIPHPEIERKLARLGKSHIDDMSITEVRFLIEVLKHIEHTIRTEKSFIKSQIAVDSYRAAEITAENIEHSRDSGAPKGLERAVNDVVTGILTPERFVKKLTGHVDDDPLYIATRELSKGANEMYAYQQQAEAMFTEWTSNKDLMERIAGKKADVLTYDLRGQTIEITPGMRMSLYLHVKNNSNLRHITNGGITIPDMSLYRKGQLAQAYYENGTTVKLTRSDIMRIIADMTDEEKAYADKIHLYFNTMSKESLNRVTEEKDGFSVANVEDYFPIDTDKSFLKANFDVMGKDGTLDHSGFLNERVEASNPIMLYDADTVLHRSIQQHSKYVGMAIPVRNFTKIWQGGKATGNMWSVVNTVNQTWGQSATDYINNLMGDVQNPAPATEGFFNKMLNSVRGNYAGGVLELNAGVAVKQAASYPTAAAVIGYKPLIKALSHPLGKIDLEQMYKYSPMQKYREKGFIDAELGDVVSRKKGLPKALNWIQGMDVATTRLLWKAAQYYVQDTSDLQTGSEEYWQEVGRVHTQILEETQPNYTVMQRPDLLRSKDAFTRILVMFKTQPFQNFNILYDATANLKAQSRFLKNGGDAYKESYDRARKNFARAVSSQLVSALVFALMQYSWDAFRRKDDKYKKDGEKDFGMWSKQIGANMLSSGFGMVPLGTELLEVIESRIDKVIERMGGDAFFNAKVYGLSDSVVDQINGIVTACSTIGDTLLAVGTEDFDVESAIRDLLDAGEDIAIFCGIPAGNVKNLLMAGVRNSLIATNGKFYGAYLADKVEKGINSGTKKQTLNNLYKAYIEDPAQYEKIRADIIARGYLQTSSKSSEKVIDDYLKDAFKEDWANGSDRPIEDLRRDALTALQADRAWEQMTADQQKKVSGIIDEWAEDTGSKTAAERILSGESTEGTFYDSKHSAAIAGGESVGLTSDEYFIYKALLEIVNDDKAGFSQAEVYEALSRSNLTESEREYLWSLQGWKVSYRDYKP